MRLLFIAVTFALAVAGGAVGLAYSGWIDVAADSRESVVVRWFFQRARESSVRRHAAHITTPSLSGEGQIAAGAEAFGEMCAACHGAPGRAPVVGARDMSPPPPDLATRAAARSPAELFWVIKHGIRMSGMPAWGATHSDKQLWELVAFLARLPGLSDDEYQALAQHGDTVGHGHHHGGWADEERAEHGHAGHSH